LHLAGLRRSPIVATKLGRKGPHDLEPSLPSQELHPISPLDYPAFRALTRAGGWALAQALDTRLAWKGLEFGLTGAQALLNAITTLTLSFIVFTFASLLMAIQVASGQYTPRIIATTLLRDNVIRYTVGLFVFTFLDRSLPLFNPLFQMHFHYRARG